MHKVLVISHPLDEHSKQEIDPYCKLSKAGLQIYFAYGGGISPDSLDCRNYINFIYCRGNIISKLKTMLDLIETTDIDFLFNSTSSVKNLINMLILKKLCPKVIPVVRIEADTPKAAVYQEKSSILKIIKTVVYPIVWRLCISSAKGVIALSKYLGELALKYGARKMVVVSQGVDIGLFKPMRTKKVYDLIFIGRISKEKNLPMLFKAFRELKKEIPSIKLCVVGDGPEKECLEREYGGEGIHFSGYVEHSELPEYYNKSKIFILTSVSEGLPTVIMEAMACGVPVIATDVGGVTELVKDGVTGFVVKPNDYIGLKEKIKYLLENEDMRVRMGNKAVQFIRREHSIEAIAGKYKRFLGGLQDEPEDTKNS